MQQGHFDLSVLASYTKDAECSVGIVAVWYTGFWCLHQTCMMLDGV